MNILKKLKIVINKKNIIKDVDYLINETIVNFPLGECCIFLYFQFYFQYNFDLVDLHNGNQSEENNFFY